MTQIDSSTRTQDSPGSRTFPAMTAFGAGAGGFALITAGWWAGLVAGFLLTVTDGLLGMFALSASLGGDGAADLREATTGFNPVVFNIVLVAALAASISAWVFGLRMLGASTRRAGSARPWHRAWTTTGLSIAASLPATGIAFVTLIKTADAPVAAEPARTAALCGIGAGYLIVVSIIAGIIHAAVTSRRARQMQLRSS